MFHFNKRERFATDNSGTVTIFGWRDCSSPMRYRFRSAGGLRWLFENSGRVRRAK